MNISETLNYIHSLNKFGIKPGLERISCLLEMLQNPQNGQKYIHVAGTNGKGSVSSMVSNILIADGRKTGLFISPYVVCFNERIQINGKYISDDELCAICNTVRPFAEAVYNKIGDRVTEFEFITAVAFIYFKQNNCDVVVLETGLGGRLDSTNIINNNLLSIITKINLDHTKVLGNTIEEIAYEKCGIIKADSAVITSDEQINSAQSVIKNSAALKNNKLIIAKTSLASDIHFSFDKTEFAYKDIDVTLFMPGRYQVYNAVQAIEAALYLNIKPEVIKKGLCSTQFPCRLEIISKSPFTVIDGAHNPDGAAALAEYLRDNNLSPVAVAGMMCDKDCETVMKTVAPFCNNIISVTVKSNPRSLSAEELCSIVNKFCNCVQPCDSYEKAIDIALKLSKENNKPILIFGSLYLASDIRQIALKRLK